MKVLISDSMSSKAEEIFKNTPGLEVDVITGLKPEELKAKIHRSTQGLPSGAPPKATAEILEAAENYEGNRTRRDRCGQYRP